MQKKTLEIFIEDVMRKFGNDYTVLGKYKNNKTPILVRHEICKNQFYVRPDIFIHNYKNGCPFCNKYKLKSFHDFKDELYKINPNYIILNPDEYKNVDTKIHVICKKCNNTSFVLPHRLLKNDRCSYCVGNHKYTIDKVTSNIQSKNKFVLLLPDKYAGNKYKLHFKCKICNREFDMSYNNIMNGSGCPHCKKSKGEKIIENILINKNIKYISQKSFKDCYGEYKNAKFKFDFEIDINSRNILLEYDGVQHFHATGTRFTYDIVEEVHKRDIQKNKYCLDHNIELARIPYTYKTIEAISNALDQILCSTTIPDEFKVVDPNGSKYSTSLYTNYLYKDEDIV